jgi:hypothetical protein
MSPLPPRTRILAIAIFNSDDSPKGLKSWISHSRIIVIVIVIVIVPRIIVIVPRIIVVVPRIIV